MADANVNVTVSGNSGSDELRQKLQEQVAANRIALNLRQQARLIALAARG